MSYEARLDLVHKAILSGQIQWKPACLERLLSQPELKPVREAFSEKGIKELLRDFVGDGNQLAFREEKGDAWYDWRDPWWYFAIIPVIFQGGLFIKVKLLWDEGDKDEDAFVEIVSIHEEKA